MSDLPPPFALDPPRFLTGSLWRHLTIMAGAGTVGLLSLFLVDFINLFYIARLENSVYTAALGFAFLIIFVNLSFSVGTSIGVSALVSRALGARDTMLARQLAASSTIFSATITLILVTVELIFLTAILEYLGARGQTLTEARLYLWITLPSGALMAVGMVCNAVLRAAGYARKSMFVTLSSSLATALLDPIFIFVFEFNLMGAAIVVSISRMMMAVLGLYWVVVAHKLFYMPKFTPLYTHCITIARLCLPIILTNIAVPVSQVFLGKALAAFGDGAIAGFAVVTRLLPIAFCGIFALSGSVNPVIGQNLGGGNKERVLASITISWQMVLIYCLIIWLLLIILYAPLITLLAIDDMAAEIVYGFCFFAAPLYFGQGLLYIGNAVFFVLQKPFYGVAFSWMRVFLGALPMIYLGIYLYGPIGGLAGFFLGSLPFGILAIIASYWYILRKI